MKKFYSVKWQRHFIKCLEGVPMIYEREPRKRSQPMVALAAISMMMMDTPYYVRKFADVDWTAVRYDYNVDDGLTDTQITDLISYFEDQLFIDAKIRYKGDDHENS